MQLLRHAQPMRQKRRREEEAEGVPERQPKLHKAGHGVVQGRVGSAERLEGVVNYLNNTPIGTALVKDAFARSLWAADPVLFFNDFFMSTLFAFDPQAPDLLTANDF